MNASEPPPSAPAGEPPQAAAPSPTAQTLETASPPSASQPQSGTLVDRPAAPPSFERPAWTWALAFCVWGVAAGHGISYGSGADAPYAWRWRVLLAVGGVIFAVRLRHPRHLRALLAVLAILLPLLVFLPDLEWKAYPIEGAWVIESAVFAGLLFSLVLVVELLLRRVRLALAGWSLVLLMHTAGMVLIGQHMVWSTGSAAAPDPTLGPHLFMLAAALGAVLLRAVVCAAEADRWILAARAGAMPAAPYKVQPRVAVLALYVAEPLAVWLGAITLVGVVYSEQATTGAILLLAVATLIVLIHAVLDLYASARAWRMIREMKGGSPASVRREGRTYLFGLGLPLAGMLSLYALFLTAHRVQSNYFEAAVREEAPALVAQLRALQPPPLSESENAAVHYREALASLSEAPDYVYFYDDWRTPGAACWVQQNAAAMRYMALATELERCEFLNDYGASVDEYERALAFNHPYRQLGQLLMLDARLAGLDRDWPTVKAQTRRTYRFARHMAHQPSILANMLAVAYEGIATHAMLASVLWHHDGTAEDAVLAALQRELADHERMRGRPLKRAITLQALLNSREDSIRQRMNALIVMESASVSDLVLNQPLLQWMERSAGRAWYTEMAEAAAQPDTILRMKDMLARQHRLPFHGRPLNSPNQLWWELEALCELRLARAALAVTRYRLKHRAWPEDLDDCVPEFLDEVPRDPYEPAGSIQLSLNPPRVWSACGPGMPHLHRPEFPHKTDQFDFVMWGQYPSEDKVFYLDPPKLKLGFRNYPPDPTLHPTSTLLQSLSDPDPTVRRAAAISLGRMGRNAQPAQADILKLAADPDPESRAWSAYLLGTMGLPAPEVLQKLDELKADSDPIVTRFARESLRWLKKP